MATQAIRQPAAEVIRSEERELWERVTDAFSPVTDFFDSCFIAPWSLETLDSNYRSTLSVKEKSEVDAHLLGM